MLISTIFLSISWGMLAGITHAFLSTLQKSPQPPVQYFFRLLLRYTILLGFALTLVKVLHGSVEFFVCGFGISTVAFLVNTVRK